MRPTRRALPIILSMIMIATGLLWHAPAKVQASTTEPVLLIGQIKITASNGQFITLYNNSSDTIDMSTIELAYYNSYDLSKSTSNKFINLSGKLAPGNYYLISDGALYICYKMTVNAVALGFSSTAGMIQIMKLAQITPGGLITSSLIDSVAWVKTAVTGVQTLPTATTDFLQRMWSDGTVKTSGGGSWQSVHPDATNPCDLQVQLAVSTTPTAITPTASTPPVTTVANLVDTPKTATTTPATNIGLVAPEITELFPNPAPPLSDDKDEFIELYNPNDSIFSLAGYRLEVGTSYSRGYTFATETLQPKSYTAFMITDTNAQLSNTEGQARLLGPDSTVISETPGYENAPEGSTWGVIQDSWQWLEKPSPNAANIPNVATITTVKATTTKKTTPKVAGASTVTASTNASTTQQLNDAAPLHPLVLAGVGLAAVAYAIYEYRKDVANKVFQIRRYLRNRRAVRARL